MAACSNSSSSNSSGQKGPYILYLIIIKIVVLIKANAQKNLKKKKRIRILYNERRSIKKCREKYRKNKRPKR